jgi:hypothetical protein
MFITVNEKRFWVKIEEGSATLTFLCDTTQKEYILINGGSNWTLKDFFRIIDRYSKMEDPELRKLAKEILK